MHSNVITARKKNIGTFCCHFHSFRRLIDSAFIKIAHIDGKDGQSKPGKLLNLIGNKTLQFSI